ncbi:MAG: ABC transporter permease [Desulfobulbaceae bacterium]|nr:ABC transporter permease [Desulfobulbaceae bacterium]
MSLASIEKPGDGRINFMRLGGLIRKESLQIIRDPSSIGIAFVLPVLLLLIFGYGVSLDARNVNIAIVVEKPGVEASQLVSGFRHSEYFAPRVMSSIQEAERAMMERRVDGIVWLRGDFSRQLLSGATAPVGVIVNGVDANKARLIEGYVGGVWLTWLKRMSEELSRPLDIPVQVEQRIWFNPAVRSRDYLVPGLIAVIMTLIGAMLTSMVVAREWERGTMEALLVTPVSIREILIGKIVPYFILGMGGMALSVVMAVFLFQVPLHGSLVALTGASALFMLTAIAMGLLISTVADSQFVAGQIAIVVTFLPAFILSGFIFDIGSMPAVIQGITFLVPARYFVAILQTSFLAGDIWPIYILNSSALMIMAVFFLLIIRKKSHKRLQ